MIKADIEILKLFQKIKTWSQGDKRAPNKPLLILHALAMLEEKQFIKYVDVDQKLKDLLIDFGPPRKTPQTHYPFWRMQNDGVWELTNTEHLSPPNKSGDIKRPELVKYDVCGGFPGHIYKALKKNPKLISLISSDLLQRSFPETIHENIIQAVGLDVELIKKKRNPAFRDNVLKAYENQCAVCGFHIALNRAVVGIEAAHIKWHSAQGPDVEKNGIALCSLHHKLFDSGTFKISDSMMVLVSDAAYGIAGSDRWLRCHNVYKVVPTGGYR